MVLNAICNVSDASGADKIAQTSQSIKTEVGRAASRRLTLSLFVGMAANKMCKASGMSGAAQKGIAVGSSEVLICQTASYK